MSTNQNAASRGLGRLLSKVAPIEPTEVPAVVTCVPSVLLCVRRLLLGAAGARDHRRPCSASSAWRTCSSSPGSPRSRSSRSTATWSASSAAAPSCRGSTAASPWRSPSSGIVLKAERGNVASGQFFYVFISVLNLFIVSVFWSFLLELFTQQQSKRLFGIIAAGGTAGALVGPFITDMRWSRRSGTAAFCSSARSCSCSRSSSSVRSSISGAAAMWVRPRRSIAVRRAARRQGPRRSSDRRQSVRGVRQGAHLAVPARHRAVRGVHRHGQHVPRTSSRCDWWKRHSRTPRIARASLRASTGSCRR